MEMRIGVELSSPTCLIRYRLFYRREILRYLKIVWEALKSSRPWVGRFYFGIRRCPVRQKSPEYVTCVPTRQTSLFKPRIWKTGTAVLTAEEGSILLEAKSKVSRSYLTERSLF